jgi:hypothetical protein
MVGKLLAKCNPLTRSVLPGVRFLPRFGAPLPLAGCSAEPGNIEGIQNRRRLGQVTRAAAENEADELSSIPYTLSIGIR